MNWAYKGNKERSESLLDLLDNPPPVVGFDFETISLKERIPVGFSIALSGEDSFYFPLYPETSNVVMRGWNILKDPNIKKIGHNVVFDIEAAEVEAHNFGHMDKSNIGCTNVMAHLMNKTRLYGSAKLMDLAQEVDREVPPAFDELTGTKTTLDIPLEELVGKCCEDSQIALLLYNKWISEIDQAYYNVEMQIIPILIDMSARGLKIDHEVRSRLEARLEAQCSHLEELCQGQGFRVSSPQQVAYVLAKRGNFLPFTKKRKSLSTADEILKQLDDPIAGMVLAWRQAHKLLSTYVKPVADEDRAYTHFHVDAITGRISSARRNMQNIPKGEPRHMYIPDSGVWTDFDYSQVELRILANLSEDPVMLDIYDSGGDIHQESADFMGIPRKISKNVNFAMIYGATPQTLMETANIRDLAKCRQLIDGWMKKYRRAGEYIIETQNFGLNHEYITTLFGRRIDLPTIFEDSEDGIKRKAINYPIQGTAAEILKRAMIKCKDLPMHLIVHDEILFDGDIKLPSGLDTIAPFITPIDIKQLPCWE